MTKEEYPGNGRDKSLLIGAGIVALAATGMATAGSYQSSELSKRPACIEIPVIDGDGPAVMLKRFEKADPELNPSGTTYVFRIDNNGEVEVKSEDDGFPSHRGSTELDLNSTVAFEHADPDACISPEVGGIVSEKVEFYDKN